MAETDIATTAVPFDDPRVRTAEPKTAPKIPLWAQITGIVGELFITAGVLIGLYIAWQLWFTSWEANTQQTDAVTVATEEWKETPQQIGAPRTDDPPAFPHITEVGAPLGVIHIPAFGSDWEYMIAQSANEKAVLDKGNFGHYKDTAYPGEIGNFALAAHRNTYGAPMHYVENLNAGDAIIIETEEAYLVYKIYDRYIVQPTQGEVIWPVPSDAEASKEPTRRLLTITTCHPYIGIQIERMITHAEFDHWVARADGIPQEMADAK